MQFFVQLIYEEIIMKKRNLVLAGAVAAVMVMSMACSSNSSSQSSAASSAASSVAVSEASKAAETQKSSEAAKADSKATEMQKSSEAVKVDAKETTKEAAKNDKKESVIKGKISDIKDMQFTITDEKGTPYLLTFDKKPEGLDKVADGDSVEVTYTGELNEVDAFTGMVISVKKAK